MEADRSLSGDQKFIWGDNKAEHFKHETKLEENFQKAYTLIFGNCTEHMCTKLEALEDYHTMWGKYNVPLLVVSIKGPTYKFDRHKHRSHSLYNANRKFCHYYQTGYTTKLQYLKTLNDRVYVVDYYVLSIGTD